jgi:hypothetical protein
MKILLLWLSLSMSFSSCWATSLPQAIQKRLGEFTTLRGQFIQVKHVHGFTAPMRSSGSFLMVPNKGLLWATKHPFKSELWMRGDKLVQRSEGVTTLLIEAKQQPAFQVMSQIMFRLLAGDMHALEEDFQLEGAIENTRWQVSLYPTNPALSKRIKQIALKGASYIETLDIIETGGDKTHITLMGQKPATLTQLESQQFE